MKLILFVLILIISNLVSCRSANNKNAVKKDEIVKTEKIMLQEKPEKCATNATVKNMTGLDGCGFVFRLDDGEVLLPDNEKELNYKLYDNQKVRISYKYLEDRVSACMAGKIVSINCIEEIIKAPAEEKK